MRKRSLVLREEGARHPFRLSLPREILQVAEEQVLAEAESSPEKFWQNEDLHLFLLSFVAFFTAFSIFIF
ncbi:hypothetical protein HF685_03620 [Parasphingorhabdus halotolerans]|uniref:Uncharacterized protein n=1 Tax=Parasphingorhabdus halotolerans TaxID=2725558 RepID=A0A6H2DPR3_9SPHN|nr:hypothetical protein HF685_03620 [Parasphingorhabdus halotolerans]